MVLMFVILLLVLSTLFEGTVIALPFVLVALIVLQIAYRSWLVMVAAFVAGLFLDALLFRPLGQSSLFFLSFLTLLAVYERRFEVQTFPFLFVSVFVGMFAYLIFFGSAAFFIQIAIAIILSVILFLLFVRRGAASERSLINR